MENFDLMEYLTGDYILQTRNGWRIANEIELRPRSDAYKIAATVVSPEGIAAQMSWTIEGGVFDAGDVVLVEVSILGQCEIHEVTK